MATPTYELIETTTLSSSASSVSFSSITQDYRDLVLVCEVTATAVAGLFVRFNNDTSNNYARVSMSGDGSSEFARESSSEDALRTVFAQLGTSDANLAIYNIMDYSATDKHKSVLARHNNTSQAVEANAYRYFGSTAAVTEIDIFPSTGNFVTGSTFSLYGIAS